MASTDAIPLFPLRQIVARRVQNMMLSKFITVAFGAFILFGMSDALTTLYAINVLGASEMHPFADTSSFLSIMTPYFVQGFAIMALFSFSIMNMHVIQQTRMSRFFSSSCIILSIAIFLIPLTAVLNNLFVIFFKYSFAVEIIDIIHSGMRAPGAHSYFINLVGLSITIPLSLLFYPYVRKNVLVPEILSNTDIRIILSYTIFLVACLYLLLRALASMPIN